MKVKSCQVQLNASTNVSFMSILERIEAQLSNKTKFLAKVLSHTIVIEVYVYKVEDNPKGVNVFVSRSHPEMIKRMMEQEIPEV